MSAERPKRHAPKKLDPDFITDTASLLTYQKELASPTAPDPVSPPRKKSRLSLNKVKSPPGNIQTSPEKTNTPRSDPVVFGTIEDDLRQIANALTPENTKPQKKVKQTPEDAGKKPRGRPRKSSLPDAAVVDIKPDLDELQSPTIGKSEKLVAKKPAKGSLTLIKKPRGRPPKDPTLSSPDTSLSNSPGANLKSSQEAAKVVKDGKPKRPRVVVAKRTELKKCDRNTCADVVPACFVGSVERCAGTGHTSRWYHLSQGEHFCNECFDNFYRSHKAGYKMFVKWKHMWSTNGCTEASLKGFMMDQMLPYWLQCELCGKWRELSRHLQVTPEFIERYQCGKNIHGFKNTENACEAEEDPRVAETQSPRWLSSLGYTCYLMMSPAAPLMTEYYQDMVGLSAYYNKRRKAQLGNGQPESDMSSSASDTDATEDEEETFRTHGHGLPTVRPSPPLSLPKWSEPFHSLGEENERALAFFPHIMNSLETAEFPEFTKEQSTYLAIRNTAVTLWNMDCNTCVTERRCTSHLVCRGLVRIRCVQIVPKILRFLSRHFYINTGAVVDVPTELKPPRADQMQVVVIGAGAAGIAAARQLHNYGVKVTVLEAKGTLGGRCLDNTSMGLCVGRGAQIINCSVNNPLSVICHQLDLLMWPIEDHCELYQEDGRVTNASLDRRMDFHFNAMLDNVAEWRKDRDMSEDTNLLSKIEELHRQFIDETQLKFTKEELKLLQFHCANLEFACGLSLDQVSAMSWDQNELYPQFSGPHCIVMSGYHKLLSALANDLDVRCNTQIMSVDYSGDRVVVTTAGGTDFLCDKVVVTVPLAILKKGALTFTPPLPKPKLTAISQLGVGVVEKVALKFPHRFWAEKMGSADFFGHVPEEESQRGVFGVFYDLKPQTELTAKTPAILVTYLCGNSLQQHGHKSDKDIINLCMETLRKLFPEKKVPEPTQFFVTHWRTDPHIGMSYTCTPVGCPPDAFLSLAETVQDRVYFAGEATNQQFPQSVTGAYISGLQRASDILCGLDAAGGDDTGGAALVYRAAQGRRPKLPLFRDGEEDTETEGCRSSGSASQCKPAKRGRKPNADNTWKRFVGTKSGKIKDGRFSKPDLPGRKKVGRPKGRKSVNDENSLVVEVKEEVNMEVKQEVNVEVEQELNGEVDHCSEDTCNELGGTTCFEQAEDTCTKPAEDTCTEQAKDMCTEPAEDTCTKEAPSSTEEHTSTVGNDDTLKSDRSVNGTPEGQGNSSDDTPGEDHDSDEAGTEDTSGLKSKDTCTESSEDTCTEKCANKPVGEGNCTDGGQSSTSEP